MSAAIPIIGPEEIKTLREILRELNEAAEQKDPHTFGVSNRKFHMQLYSYSQYPMLCDMIRDLWNKAELNRCRSVFFLVPNIMTHSQKEHSEILTLIEQNRSEEAVAVLQRHKNYSRVKLLEEMEKNRRLNLPTQRNQRR